MKTIVVSVVHVDGMHSLFELAIRHDFADVFEDKLARFETVATPYAPTFLRGHEAFKALSPAVALDSLVHALITHWTHLTAAFRVHHPVKAVISAATNINFLF